MAHPQTQASRCGYLQINKQIFTNYAQVRPAPLPVPGSMSVLQGVWAFAEFGLD